jgi:lipid A 3-O-deacylase
MFAHLRAILVGFGFVATGLTAQALELPPVPPGAELQLFIENDMLASTDRYYTHGIKIGAGVPFDVLQFPATEVLRQLVPKDDSKIHLGFFVGQNLYTPKSIKISTPQPDDRPWAGWLYVGGVAQRAKGNRLDTVELDVGMVGPAALGEAVQSNWHRMIGSPQPMGWDHQLRNEPAFLMSYLHKRRYAYGDFEVVPHAGATVGTVMTMARAGGLIRYGYNMSGFGPDSIEPGGAMLHNMRKELTTEASGLEWYVFLGVDHRLVAHNIFLDGGVFRDGPSVSRRPHVYDVTAGWSLRLNALRFSVTRVRRSEEFYTPTSRGGHQTFDSINLGMEF